ncbi:hypothetical protein OAO87_03610 [bacterium]|nr:hypothetical protein [bacterium]
MRNLTQAYDNDEELLRRRVDQLIVKDAYDGVKRFVIDELTTEEPGLRSALSTTLGLDV